MRLRNSLSRFLTLNSTSYLICDKCSLVNFFQVLQRSNHFFPFHETLNLVTWTENLIVPFFADGDSCGKVWGLLKANPFYSIHSLLRHQSEEKITMEPPTTVFFLLLIWAHLCLHASAKVCTNMQRDYFVSHTFRYELLSSDNETLKQELFASHYNHNHLTPTDDSAWFSLFPRKMLREEDERDWAALYRTIKNSDVGTTKGAAAAVGYSSLKEISLHDVRLDSNSTHGQAQKTNLDYLLLLENDRLVWSFKKTAGLETAGVPYGGWEGPGVELRGHFVGHYLSATAHMWASTHNELLRQKMNSIVSTLSECQEKLGTGYLSAFPSELFDRFEAYEPVWAPYYTIHKIMAGLLDQYALAGNEQALKMTVSMAEYFYNRVQNVINKYTIERHWLTLNEETGGMNDVLYKLYGITGDQKHLALAHLFDKPCFLGPLALKDDTISGFHTNTHIPVVIGAQRRYEVTGDPLYKEIGTFFMDIVNSSHSYATGGTSVHEFWSDPKRLATTLGKENEESCTTYNMLKVSRHLLRWTKEMAYADYYERALTNGVLSIQRGNEPGKMIYMIPLGRGISKAKTYHGWGTQNDSFWCCYGTGIESFSKLGDSIYFEEEGDGPALYVIQYIPSTVTWRSGHISLRQQVDGVVSWDPFLRATFTVTSKEQAAGTSTVNFRIPLWTSSSKGTKASLNGQDLPLTSPGNFLSVSRTWNAGDRIAFELPITHRLEAIKDDRPEYSSLHAIFYGPYLLAGLSYGEWDIKASPSTPFSDYITPIPNHYNSQLITLSQQTVESVFVLKHTNQSLTMENIPYQGTDSCASSTFRIVLKEPTSSDKFLSTNEELIDKLVVLEPYNYPGTAVVHGGAGGNLGISEVGSKGSIFRIVHGLDGHNGSVSLESYDDSGCYVYSGFNYQSGERVKLSCEKSRDSGFKWGASFNLRKGLSEYHPMSFVAKGLQRNFLMVPLLSLRDENYTVYFNFMS